MGSHEPFNPYSDTEYDRSFNLLYIKVNPTLVKSGIVKSKSATNTNVTSNLGIYDIGKDKLSHFFEINHDKVIIAIIYEKRYNEENKQFDFNVSSAMIFNNYDIEKREKADVLFVVAYIKSKEHFEFWKSSRNGENKVLVKTYEKERDWRIDVYNQKIIFIHKKKNEVEVEAFDW